MCDALATEFKINEISQFIVENITIDDADYPVSMIMQLFSFADERKNLKKFEVVKRDKINLFYLIAGVRDFNSLIFFLLT